MRFPILVIVFPTLLQLVACTVEEAEPERISWDPPLDADGNGTLEFGDVPQNPDTPPQSGIVATNVSDEDIVFDVDCSDLAGEFLATCPTVQPGQDGITVAPGATIQASVRFFAAEPGEYQGLVQFYFDDEVVGYVVHATRLED